VRCEQAAGTRLAVTATLLVVGLLAACGAQPSAAPTASPTPSPAPATAVATAVAPTPTVVPTSAPTATPAAPTDAPTPARTAPVTPTVPPPPPTPSPTVPPLAIASGSRTFSGEITRTTCQKGPQAGDREQLTVEIENVDTPSAVYVRENDPIRVSLEIADGVWVRFGGRHVLTLPRLTMDTSDDPAHDQYALDFTFKGLQDATLILTYVNIADRCNLTAELATE
jgi:hypothetical protein